MESNIRIFVNEWLHIMWTKATVVYCTVMSEHFCFVDGLSKTIDNGRIVAISDDIRVRDLQDIKQKGPSP